ncbi:MAG TPA: hypothetical protein PKV71_01790 [Calditrichia bacterium]|nr:hypothetical protein [Calditrichota bacterium]HQU70895.1 hypothetical protein [Calditrichia bacterium]HQV30574.1 hypothetical protein [Calditrichia bacterium]
MRVITTVPLFAILLIFYNALFAFTRVNRPDIDLLNYALANFTLPSGEIWFLTGQDALIIIGLIVLYIELVKATSASDTSIIEHVFSMMVFLAYLFEFLFFPYVADSAFLILCVMSLIDVLAGFTISVISARRDLTVG